MTAGRSLAATDLSLSRGWFVEFKFGVSTGSYLFEADGALVVPVYGW